MKRSRFHMLLASGVGAVIGACAPHVYCVLALGAVGVEAAHALGLSPLAYYHQFCGAWLP